jgi:hypothetical protein
VTIRFSERGCGGFTWRDYCFSLFPNTEGVIRTYGWIDDGWLGQRG